MFILLIKKKLEYKNFKCFEIHNFYFNNQRFYLFESCFRF